MAGSDPSGWTVIAAVGAVAALLAIAVQMRERKQSELLLSVSDRLGFSIVTITTRAPRLRTTWWDNAANPAVYPDRRSPSRGRRRLRSGVAAAASPSRR